MRSLQRQKKLRRAIRAYLLLKELRRRQFWIHPILLDRSQAGQFHTLYMKLREDGEKFFTYTRMTVPTFDKLLDLLEQR